MQRRLAVHRDHPHRAATQYLLAGYAWCPNCDALAAARTPDGPPYEPSRLVGGQGHMGGPRRSTKPQPRYRCRSMTLGAGRLAGPDGRKCTFTASAAVVEGAVRDRIGALVALATDPELSAARFMAALERAWAALRFPRGEGAPGDRAAATELAQTEARIEGLQRRLKEARARLYDGTITAEEYRQDADDLRAVLAVEETRRRRLTGQTEPAPDAAAPVVPLLPPLDEAPSSSPGRPPGPRPAAAGPAPRAPLRRSPARSARSGAAGASPRRPGRPAGRRRPGGTPRR